MKNKQFFILILLLVIGFASISATLVINGNTKIAANLDDFNVMFIEGFLNGETSPNVVISEDKKTLTFTTDKLTNINDTARVDYKVKNVSTQYDGDVTINCTNAANSYVTITSSFDGRTLPLTDSVNMQAQEVKSGYINVELTKAVSEDQEVKITCKIEVTATSRTNYAYSLSFNSNGGTDVEDKIVEYNASYGELSIPEKEGYTFIGWFNEDDVKVDESTILDTKGNKTLTAKWAENTYPVEIRKVYKDKTETEIINIPYGEYVDTLITVGEEYYISDIECTNGYTIDSFNKDKIIYNEQTIRIKNNSITKESTCTISINKGIFAYSYTGAEQEFIVPLDGNYKVELWGASGGIYADARGGNGAYTSGDLVLTGGKLLYVYVGEEGHSGSYHTGGNGGYNGGAKAQNTAHTGAGNSIGSGGGGATDIRLVNGSWNNFDSLKSRIMVAAGGAGSSSSGYGGFGGALTGGSGSVNSGSNGIAGSGYGASQTGGGSCMINGSNSLGGNCTGSFGLANTTSYYSSPYVNTGAGGGGGYYGGGSSSTGSLGYAAGGGGGGSSFISGHTGCNAISKDSVSSNIIHTGQPNHYLGYIFSNTNMKAGNEGMLSHDGKSTMTGNSGNGYAKITYLG